MNKEDIKKVNNRIDFLRGEFDANNKKIQSLQTENNRIQGAVKELALIIENLSPKKKEKTKDGNS